MLKIIIKVFFTAIIILEIPAFLVVYHSNQNLYKTISMLKQAGHIVVPNDHILPSLANIIPVFYSSLFILATAGIIIALSISFLTMLFFIQKFKNFNELLKICTVFFMTLTISAIALLNFADNSIFLKVRDYLLLGNTPGIVLNNLYYKYTPYAAQAVASSLNNPIKSCWIDSDLIEHELLEKIIFKYGWLNICNSTRTKTVTMPKVDLHIKKSSDNNLLFRNKNQKILSVSATNFIQDPAKFFKRYSKKTDEKKIIRFLCMAGLFAGLPFFCFTLLFLVIFFLCRQILKKKGALCLTAIVIFGFIILTILYLYPVSLNPHNKKSIQTMLDAKNHKTRVKALRIVYQRNLNIWQFQDYCKTHINSDSIAEKYWIANILSKSKTKKNVIYLKQLLKDDSVNVQCASIKALSRFGCDNESIKLFKNLVINSRQWYVQQYAFNALKRCK